MSHIVKNFEQLNTLVELSSLIISTLDTGEIRRRTIEAAVKLLDVEAGSLIMIYEDSGDLFFEVALGDKSEKIKEVRLLKGEGIAGWVAEKGEPVIVNDVLSDSRFSNHVDDQIGFTSRNILCVPIKSKNKIHGVLEVINKKNGSFDDDDTRTLVALSNQVAIAIENAKLYQEVKEREDRFHAIVDTIPDAILILDREGRIYLWNTSAERIFGFTSEEARGEKLHVLIAPPRSYDAYLAYLTHVKLLTYFKESGRGPAVEITSDFFAMKKDSTEFPIEISSSSIQIEGTWHAILTIRDITDRKRFENELLENEKRFRELYEKAPLGIHSLDSHGRIIDVNGAWLDMLGYSKKEVIGRWFGDFMTPKSAKVFDQGFSVLKSSGEMKDEEFDLIHHDGIHLIVSMNGRALYDKKGNFLQTQCIINDITDRKKAVEVLANSFTEIEESYTKLDQIVRDRTKALTEANLRLQELDRLKSMFIASMSHELRTPLNSVIGFSSILLNEWIGPINTEQKDNLSIILRAGKHLLALINDVIDVSKIEAGTIDCQAVECNLNDVITETVNLFSKEIKEKGIALTVESINQTMYTDRRRLLQCLINLMSNAVKFTEQGSISLKARKIADGEFVEIIISDTGIGIMEQDIPKLFVAFSRIDAPMKETVPGTGLGLYLTKKLVTELLRGNIDVTSTYGTGSAFAIKIPSKIPRG